MSSVRAERVTGLRRKTDRPQSSRSTWDRVGEFLRIVAIEEIANGEAPRYAAELGIEFVEE
jgi:hypothetical protein